MATHASLVGADLHISKNNTGSGSPIGVITPGVIGEGYVDLTTGIFYTANGLTNTSWVIPIEYYGMSLQASINSDYQIAQQGTSFTNPANLAYTLDMNMVQFTNTGTLPTTIVHSQVTLTSGEVYKSKYAYNINVNGAGSGFGVSDAYGKAERIEHGVQALCGNGKKVTISKMFKSDIAGKRIAVGLKQVYGTGGSPSAAEILTPTATTIRTLTAGMVLYTWTFTTNTLTGKIFGSNNDDYLEYTEYVMWGATFATNNLGGGTAETFVGAGNITTTQKQINVGDTALPYQPKSFDDELKACLRFFEKSYNYSVPVATSVAGGGVEYRTVPSNTVVPNQSYGKIGFKVIKRAVPNMTIYPYTTPANTGRVSDSNGTDLAALSGGTTGVGDSGFVAFNNSGASLTTAAFNILYHWTADARL